jgi:hypothetical protein
MKDIAATSKQRMCHGRNFLVFNRLQKRCGAAWEGFAAPFPGSLGKERTRRVGCAENAACGKSRRLRVVVVSVQQQVLAEKGGLA